ncbi:MAG: hypothetical protein GX025_11020 [Clostridiales bacterium]|nr:hypothetical protein [Clostridiales bacterium]
MNAKLQKMLDQLNALSNDEHAHLMETNDAKFVAEKDSGFQWQTEYYKLIEENNLTWAEKEVAEKLNLRNYKLVPKTDADYAEYAGDDIWNDGDSPYFVFWKDNWTDED